jgi:hypothetical protein
MTLNTSHVSGDSGHIADHNEIAVELNAAPSTYAHIYLARPMLFTKPSAVGSNTNGEIWAAKSDGTGQVQLTNDNNYQSWWPKWSPNGRRILFLRQPAAQTNYDDPTQFANTSLWVMNSDGTGVTQIVAAGTLGATAGTKSLFTPNWMPNGHDIVCAGGANNLVYIIRDDGSNATTASPITITGVASGAADTAPSPDGKLIAFTYAQDVWLVSVAGGGKTQVTTDGATTQHYDPVWSPDGSKLVILTKFAAPDGGHAIGQWTLQTCTPSASATLTTITDTNNAYSKGSWGQDGQIYMHGQNYTTPDTTFSLFRVRDDGATAVSRITGPGAGRQEYPDIYVVRVATFFRGAGSGIQTDQNITAPQVVTTGAMGAVGGISLGDGTALGPSSRGGSGAPSGGLGSTGDNFNRSDSVVIPPLRRYVKSGAGWIPDSAVASTTVNQTVTNSAGGANAAETILSSYTVTANSLYAGALLRLHAVGNTDNIATSGTFIFRLRWGGIGGTIIATSTIASQGSANTVLPWWLDADILATTIGASGTISLGGVIRQTIGLNLAALASGSVTVDTTASKDLVLTVQMATVNAGNITRLFHSTYEWV